MSRTIEVTAQDGTVFAAYMAVPPGGSGPAIVLLQEIFGVNAHIRAVADLYAEEGYVVLAPDLFRQFAPGIELTYDEAGFRQAFAYYEKLDMAKAVSDVTATVALARTLPEVTGPRSKAGPTKMVGALGFCLGGTLAYLAAAQSGVDCAVGYYGVGIEKHLDLAGAIDCPLVLHYPGLDRYAPPEVVAAVRTAFAGRPEVEIFAYPEADHAFNRPGARFHKPSAMMAHSRSLTVFRRVMGPVYDLSTLADQHFAYEFATRDVEATMKTMVAEPYVNHVPTMTGGTGYTDLHRFYKHHFIGGTPNDTKLVPISRTIGADRLVDEMLFCFTHDIEIDWMLPGIPPTGKYVEIPLVAVVNFRGDKLYHEHIYWDQASVLVQIGVLDPALVPAIAGVETARKLLDTNLPSNALMPRWKQSAPAAE